MPIHAYWEDAEKTIVRHDLEGEWTWEEMYASYYKAVEMEMSVTNRVDVILDMRNSNRIIPGNVLLHVKNFSEKQPPNVGICIFVTPSPFLAVMYNSAVKCYAKIAFYFRFAKTLDDAHAMIAESRRTQAAKQMV